MNKKSIIYLFAFIVINSAKGQFFSIYSEATYDINFWEDVENYERKNDKNNFGVNLGLGFNYKKTSFNVFYGKSKQTFSNVNPDVDPPPWRLKYASFNSDINNWGVGINHQIFAKKNFDLSVGFRTVVSTFKKTVGYYEYYTGSNKKYTFDVSKLDKRIAVNSSIKLTKTIKRVYIYSSIGHQSVLRGLNPEQIPPATVLPNNTKAAITMNVGMGYNFEKPKK